MVISNKAADEADPAERAQHLLSEVSRGGSPAVKHCEGKVIREGGDRRRGEMTLSWPRTVAGLRSIKES